MNKCVPIHSPGPWSYSEQAGTKNHCLLAQVWDAEGNSLARIESTEDCNIATANAKLMAAAPAMLQQIDDLIEVFEMDSEANDPNTDAYVVIMLAKMLVAQVRGEVV